MVHGKLEIHFDKDDEINKNEIYRTNGSTFEDVLGEIHATWLMKSKEEVGKILSEVCKILQEPSTLR